jgi:hypothetical protein
MEKYSDVQLLQFLDNLLSTSEFELRDNIEELRDKRVVFTEELAAKANSFRLKYYDFEGERKFKYQIVFIVNVNGKMVGKSIDVGVGKLTLEKLRENPELVLQMQNMDKSRLVGFTIKTFINHKTNNVFERGDIVF